MTGTLSPQIPTVNSPNSTQEPKIPSALITLRDGLNAVLNSSNILDGAKLAAGTVATAALANLSVTAAKIGLGEVNALHLANDAVTTNAIEDLNVTGPKIAAGTINASKLALTVLTNELGATDVGIPATWADYCSVTPIANATYLVMAVVNGHLTSGSGASNVNVRLFKDSAADVTIDEYPLGAGPDMQAFSIPILTTLTPTTTNAIKLQAQREGAAGITIRKEGTRLVAVRIG